MMSDGVYRSLYPPLYNHHITIAVQLLSDFNPFNASYSKLLLLLFSTERQSARM